MSAKPQTFREALGKKFSGPDPLERDFVTLGIAIAALILFVGIGGTVMPQMVRAWQGLAGQPDVVLTNALLLNIAVILLGWNRYKSLKTELERTRLSEEMARKLADIDALTGCYNRRSIAPALAALIESAGSQGLLVATVLIDLDNFKQVNDLNGHNIGDEVLKITADRLGDVLPADSLLARLGGDEFACAIPYCERKSQEIDHLVSLLIEKVALPIAAGGVEVEITMSVGIVSSDWLHAEASRTDISTEMIHKADIAMYHAKKQGKNRYFWFEPAMEYELRFRNELESGIRKGIISGEFIPYYEQQIDLDTGALVGFEMLARWRSKELGMIGPDIFIPIAEEIGAIAELSVHLMAQAFEDAKIWDSSLSLAINISPVQLRDPWFSQKLIKLLVQHNFPPSRLEVEITESCLHENIGMVRTMITSLRNQGIRVSLDDFGTGYSSLAQLRSLPFDRIKIDRSFVRELKQDGTSSKLIDAIISMGDGLQMPITAEGIETPEILELLKQMGSLKGQGYHYGQPEPAEKVAQRLASMGLLDLSKLEASDLAWDLADNGLQEAGGSVR
ncbi:MAG: putative bifunctional diguanylate cyclase/phosphodiesterase [Qipengyuania sp.]